LALRGASADGDNPTDRITPETVREYIIELDRLGNKKGTILARLEELTEMAKVLGPDRRWSFIAKMVSRVRARRDPPSAKHARLVCSDELVSLGLRLMDSAAGARTPRRAAVLFRDGLIIALLALRPLRLRQPSAVQT
jgi:hypothetical protein